MNDLTRPSLPSLPTSSMVSGSCQVRCSWPLGSQYLLGILLVFDAAVWLHAMVVSCLNTTARTCGKDIMTTMGHTSSAGMFWWAELATAWTFQHVGLCGFTSYCLFTGWTKLCSESDDYQIPGGVVVGLLELPNGAGLVVSALWIRKFGIDTNEGMWRCHLLNMGGAVGDSTFPAHVLCNFWRFCLLCH